MQRGQMTWPESCGKSGPDSHSSPSQYFLWWFSSPVHVALRVLPMVNIYELVHPNSWEEIGFFTYF